MKWLAILLVIVTPSLALSQGPFVGEGKINYIERCISSFQSNGYSYIQKKEYCSCFANRIEESYGEVTKVLEQTGDYSKAQKKADEIAGKYAAECIKKAALNY